MRTIAFRALLASLIGVLALAAAPGAGAEEYREHELKAAFLFSFTKYVEWPPARLPAADTPITIAVTCDDPLQAALKSIAWGRQVNGRSVKVRVLASVAEAASAHIIFVCGSDDARLAAIREAARGMPILLVGESDQFWAEGGMIRLQRVGDQLRFSIDVRAAEGARLKISAQLQKLALNLRRNGAKP